MNQNDANKSANEFLDRHISALEQQLTNAKNHVLKLKIQLSELKQRQKNRATTRNRISELFVASSSIENAKEI